MQRDDHRRDPQANASRAHRDAELRLHGVNAHGLAGLNHASFAFDDFLYGIREVGIGRRQRRIIATLAGQIRKLRVHFDSAQSIRYEIALVTGNGEMLLASFQCQRIKADLLQRQQFAALKEPVA